MGKLNRHDRRARLRELGYTWRQAREVARMEMLQANQLAARKALAEWAARGGNLARDDKKGSSFDASQGTGDI